LLLFLESRNPVPAIARRRFANAALFWPNDARRSGETACFPQTTTVDLPKQRCFSRTTSVDCPKHAALRHRRASMGQNSAGIDDHRRAWAQSGSVFADRRSERFRIVCGDTLALTPPMGGNSWNFFAHAVSAEKVKGAADAMVKSGLINHGSSSAGSAGADCIRRNNNHPA
jgi:hypothetical protein